MVAMRTSALTLALVMGCQDYLFNQVCPQSIRESSITVPAATPTPADILFVVDNSGSMADEQQNLADNFDKFINEIAGAGDYHIGIVTTDQMSAGGEQQGLQSFVFGASFPNILTDFNRTNCATVQPAIDHGCFRGAQESRIIDSNVLDRTGQIAAFKANVLVGSCGSGNEQGLRGMISALQQRGGCNTGFLRDNANLVIIIVSDEEDADNVPVAQYVNDLKQIKSPSQVRVAVIVGSVDGAASDCNIADGRRCGSFCDNLPPRGSQNNCTMSSQCPGGEYCDTQAGECENELLRYETSCNSCSFYQTPDCCSAVAGGRYVDFARMMENEITTANPTIPASNCRAAEGRLACFIDTICQTNFGDTLARIARDLVLTNEYNLDPPAAYPPGVSVIVKNGRFGADGVKLVYGPDFEVSADGRVLTIKGEKTPVQGEDIDIQFVVEKEARAEMPRGACAVTQ
jgi:hypothetical protein